GSEEQRVRRPVRGCAVAELQRPEAVDRKGLPVRRPQLAAVDELAARQLLVRVDLSVAEVADEQIPAEAAEVRRRPREPPRRVQLTVLRHAREQIPRKVVRVDEPETLAGQLVS